jgi:hypothetical protein
VAFQSNAFQNDVVHAIKGFQVTTGPITGGNQTNQMHYYHSHAFAEWLLAITIGLALWRS